MGDPNESSSSHRSLPAEGLTASRSRRLSASGRWRREDVLPSGSHIGRYVVLFKEGRGGMGVVYAAYDPQLDRKVAVKVLAKRSRPTDSRGSNDRMLREAQALARLSHPNVVAVHDAGLLDGRVFVAMDFIDGETLRRWIKSKPRTPREILGAYLQAGEALVAAHAAEIVHRDFKPDNAIIGRDGRVQVLDFGLARLGSNTPASGPARDPATRETTHAESKAGGRQGTPAYMAPEQHDRERVGPAADQFSFCVSLWEALCGRAPFAGKDDELVANIKAGRVVEPARGVLSGHLRRQLRRGLSADPSDRHPSMRALLAQLRVDPRSRWRRIGLALGGAALIGGGAAGYAHLTAAEPPCTSAPERLASAWDDARRDRIATAIASAGRGHGEHTQAAVALALDDYATGWGDAYREACEATHVRREQSEAQLDLRMACLSERLEELDAVTALLSEADPDMVDRALVTVDGLGAVRRCADVVGLRESQPLPRDPEARRELETTRAGLANALALERAGRVEDAITAARDALQRAQQQEYRPLQARAGLALGIALQSSGAYDEARQVLVEAEVAAEVGRDDPLLADIRLLLLVVEGSDLAQVDRGHTWAKLARATLERRGGDLAQEAQLEHNLALVIEHEAPPEEVLAHQQRAIELAEQAGMSELRLAGYYSNLATTLADVGRFDEALARAQQARQTWERTLGTRHHRIAGAMSTLGYIHDRRGDPRQALHWYEQGYEQMVRELGPDSPRTVNVLANLAISQAMLGMDAPAEQSFRKVVTLLERELGPDHIDVARAHANLGVQLSRAGHLDEALEHQRQALAIKERALGRDNPQVASSLEEVANVLEKLARHGEALALRDHALELRERVYGPQHPSLLTTLANLAHNQLLVGDRDRALTQAERALQLSDDPSVQPIERAFAGLVLAKVLSARDEQLGRARALFDRAQEALTDHEAPAERQLLAELSTARGWPIVASPRPSSLEPRASP
ncbi:MAG: serine/threonine-protein kinase [Nannocystaceae bacterium]